MPVPLSKILQELGLFHRVAMPSQNPLAYIGFKLGLSHAAALRYATGTLLLTKDSVKVRGIAFEYNNRDLAFVPLPVHEIFIEEIYGKMNVAGRTVIDVGASVGDTAAYFLTKRANRVIGFEPHKRRYEAALRNLRRNGMLSKVRLFNKPASGLDWRRLGKDLALKVDCEGCEYALIPSIDPHAVSEAIIEYHRGPEPLVKALKGLGYDVLMLSRTNATTGVMYAVRKRGRQHRPHPL